MFANVNIHIFLLYDTLLVEVFRATVKRRVLNSRFPFFFFFSTLYHLFQLLTPDKQWLCVSVFGGKRWSYNRSNTLAMCTQRIQNKAKQKPHECSQNIHLFKKKKNIHSLVHVLNRYYIKKSHLFLIPFFFFSNMNKEEEEEAERGRGNNA